MVFFKRKIKAEPPKKKLNPPQKTQAPLPERVLTAEGWQRRVAKALSQKE